MSKVQNDILIVVPKLEYKLSTDRLLSIPIQLDGKRKELIDSERTINVNATEQSNVERSQSQKYRIGGKITQIFNNTLQGVTNYEDFKNYLYLTNPLSVIQKNDVLFNNDGVRVPDTFGLKWGGYPQYNEFNFIRYDADNPHLNYEPQSASTYNWMCYLSYVYSHDTGQTMSYVNSQISGNPVNFIVSDGIPFTIINTTANGKNYITFRCGGKHNLTPSQFVELSINYNGINLFQVETIGEAGQDNEDTSFSIVNYGYTGNTFVNGVSGTFKRIGDINNTGETKSKYYVRVHKLLTNENGVILNKMGFENSPFIDNKKLEYSALTPNLVQRVSTLDGTQSYSFTVVRDLEISNLTNTFNEPVNSVYLTIINKGFTGWFNKPNADNFAIQYGWDFNFQQDSIDRWWNLNNSNSYENIQTSSYSRTTNSGTYIFYYNQPLVSGDTLIGDFCEYNEGEQMEYVISSCNHKLTFNETLYQIESQSSSIPEGYFYKPHYEIPLRVFSNSISTESSIEPLNRPYWAYFSESDGLWKWRNLLLPGEIEDDGNGFDYPFTNGAHYPFSQFLFLMTTPFRNINTSNEIIDDPIIDECE